MLYHGASQVDASQGAEEMVEQLTEKTLQQEEKLQQLEEEKSDLVTLTEYCHFVL